MELITVSQLAKRVKRPEGRIGVNPSYIYKLAKNGSLPYTRLGNQIIFNADSREIIDFIEGR